MSIDKSTISILEHGLAVSSARLNKLVDEEEILTELDKLARASGDESGPAREPWHPPVRHWLRLPIPQHLRAQEELDKRSGEVGYVPTAIVVKW